MSEHGRLSARTVCVRLLRAACGVRADTITLAKEPDHEFIMDYVYGMLSKHMAGYHTLAHLVNEGLIHRPEPRTIAGAIASTGIANEHAYVSNS